ncbi:MAG: 3-phosphoshikimate 1-carboxyvinyltransferase [Actinomycetota bacterium]
MNRTFHPAGRLSGTIGVPGDKSISHRAAMFAAMAKGRSVIDGLGPGRDVASTLECLGALGYSSERIDGGVALAGDGWSVEGNHSLDAGNSGTTMRLLAGALGGRPGRFTITGDESLSRRPMERIAVPLRQMGAGISLSSGHAPVVVEGGSLRGIDYTMPVASAQVKGAILLAGTQASGTTSVIEAASSRDHTERMLRWLGKPVTAGAGIVQIEGGGEGLEAFEMQVPGDFSSAAFWLVAAILVPLSQVRLEGVGLNPTRTALLDVLAEMGASFQVEKSAEEPEPLGSLETGFARLQSANIGAERVPQMIDELPLVALAATQAEGETVIEGAEELRAKESDRIGGLAAGLSALGGKVEELADGLRITGPTALSGGEVDSLGDHRLAMAFAIAGLIASAPVKVKGWDCAAVSYPGFEDDLRALHG